MFIALVQKKNVISLMEEVPGSKSIFKSSWTILFGLVLLAVSTLVGCGTGGYPGAGLVKLSASAMTLDANQAFQVVPTLEGSPNIAWSLTGPTCTGASCGTLSDAAGAAIIYTAPSVVPAQMKVSLVAGIAGTTDSDTVAITVNPDPTISGTPLPGVVGVAYTAPFTVAGGTAPFGAWSVASGSLPPGLTLNTATGAVVGTPTLSGSFTFAIAITDSSVVPYTVTATETIVVVAPNSALAVVRGNPPSGTVGTAYTTTITATGGVLPYSWSVTSGAVPNGLALNASSGVLSGVPTTQGVFTFTAQVQDANGTTASAVFSVLINPVITPLVLTLSSLPNGTVGVPYSALIGVSGGTAPYSCAITAGTLQAGLSLSGCTVSGTPSVSGTVALTVKATDSSNPALTTTGPVSLTINPVGSLALSSLPNGTVGVAYNAVIGVSGGTAPYSCTVIAGALEAGLTANGCAVSGTPTASGAVTLTVTATDSSVPQRTITGPVGLIISPAPLTLSLSTLPNGTVGVPYSAVIGVSGGTAPYYCVITAGTLQAGLSLTDCTVSGTPTASGTVGLTVKAIDSGNPIETTTGPVGLTINPAGSLTLSSLPNGTVGVAYNSVIGVSGGTAPYSCTVIAGTLQAGLTLNGCTVSGTPTLSGTVTLSVKATDASNPAKTTTGPVSLTINPAALQIALGTLPNGTVGVPYSAVIGVTGGTPPYSCTITAGALPAGLSLTGCTVSGTPTISGTVNLTVKATDSGSPTLTTTGPVSLTINPAPLQITIGTLPNGTVGVPYSAVISVTGGTAPYSCAITAGTLQAGLSLTGCTVSGTPTVSGAVNLTVKATDSGNPALTTTAPVSLTINPAGSLTLSSLPNGTVGVAYSAVIGVSGGTAPYTCTVLAGTLQAGLTVNGCTVSGTPTVSGAVTLSVKATDASNPAKTTTGPVALTVNPAPLQIVLGTLPNGTVGVPYSAVIGVTGGTAPYSCAITAGTLPAGLLLAGCTVSGIPILPGTVNLTVRATDSSNPIETTTGPVGLTINPTALQIALGTLPNGTVGVPYLALIVVTGGTAPYSCAITAGALPAGLSLTGCTVSGTPTVSGTVNLTVKATDSSNPVETTSGPVGLTINPAPLQIVLGPLPNGTVGVPYSAVIAVTGGTAPYSCAITAGALPAGLSLTGCTVSGTPTVSGTVVLTVKVTDSGNPAETTTGAVGLTINPANLLTLSSLPNGTVGVAYNAVIGVSGGTAPYSCTVLAGTLQAGLTVNNCTVSGTPTLSGAVTLTVKATDASTPTRTATGPVSLTINPAPLQIVIGTLPDGTVGVPYSAVIGVTGGTAPYSCAITAGTLQAGLSLTGCTVSGTPTLSGAVNLTVKATDSGSPNETTTGAVGLTINPAGSLTLSSLPNGTVGVAYNSVIGVSGGTAPYICTILSGTVPAGLTVNNCTVSGTPTLSGPVTLSVKATDASNPAKTTTAPVALTINPAPLRITIGLLPNGTVGVPYSAVIAVTGGTAPYSCAITAGTLQAGLSLTGCTVSGTPTISGSVNLTVKATDSGNPNETTTGPVALTINPAPVNLIITSPPNGTVGTPYVGTIGVSGGTAPYTCAIVTGTLPAGLTISNCTISGTPTASGTTPLTIMATDSSNPIVTKNGPVSITIAAAGGSLTIASPPPATAGTPYTGPIGITGGTGPYTCTLAGGTLPPGLTLTGCVVTGTPTTAGSTTVTVTVTDSGNPTLTQTGPITITVLPPPLLTLTGSLPNGIINVPYTQTLHAAGGVAPYTYALTAGTLPPGITLSADGVISGTPTAVGASSFTVTATDAEATPQTASVPLILLVTYPTTPQDADFTGPYAFLFQGYDDSLIGVVAYGTATVGSFTADGTGVINSGEMDLNHQASTPAETTVASNPFLGTYTIGADLRGMMTITSLKADGTVGNTSTYAIALKAPTAPATISVEASMIEFDSNQLRGTKGSGSILAQDSTSFTAGLTGTYAFGLQGETPCLPTCTIDVVAGPVASVGEFTANGTGTISTGMSDANIAQITYTSEALTGTYGAADLNGRVQLSLTTASTPADAYPSDYAVYLVSGGKAFILSTDKHSAYIMLAGSAERQTQAVFNDASMNAPFVGYENTATNPGLVGTVLQNTLNLSTATIFRGTSNAVGTCDITNVDIGGLVGLVNGLTGIGSGVPILNALLGTYESTGTSLCPVAGNGRGVLNYPAPNTLLAILLETLGLPVTAPPARVFYLASPNLGYFLETGYAGLGNFEPQTGAPFSLATFDGTYIYASTPDSSAASINSSGEITADGAGHATSTQDLNIGVGTLNVLQLGVTGSSNYVLTDLTAGRYTLGANDVIYAISPSRFVLLDENPLTTSPTISLLY